MTWYKYYSTPHVFSQVMGDHVKNGFGAQVVPAYGYIHGSTAMMYGILRGTGRILRYCDNHSLDYLYIDHSYFYPYRGYPDDCLDNKAYFRVVKNDRYWRNIKQQPHDRWNKLNIHLKPWNISGDKIIIVPMSRFVAQFNNIDAKEWLNGAIQTLVQYTDKQIILKPKTKGAVEGLDELYKTAWAFVTADSLSAISALINGIPCFTSSQNPAALLSRENLADIENPLYPDYREDHFAKLAYQQFTQQELSDGTAKGIIESL